MIDIDEMRVVLDRIEGLPTLPTVYVKISELMQDPGASLDIVSRVIESDPAIASKILKLVNSSFFGFSRQVSSIRQAVVLLGFNEIRNTALSVSIIKSFSSENTDSINLRDFWKHSIGCGIICSRLDKELVTGCQEETFVAGVLHDIGKIILDRYFKNEFFEALVHSRQNRTLLFEGERVVIGCSHDEVGEYITEVWKLPDSLIEAVALHHQPASVRENSKLVSLVHLSDCFAHRLGLGLPGDYFLPEFDPFALNELNLQEQMIPGMLEEMEQVLDESEELFSIIGAF